MMLSSRNSSSSCLRSPFTAIQWQELENQALIYKYLVSGVPIPPDLITTVRRSLDSSLSSKLYPHHQQPIGWGCFELGIGRKPDPEPGRCRRTDGKKWRCPKEAYPGSRYCERHIHRGKSKAKKQLLEAATNNNNNNNSAVTPTSSPLPVSNTAKNPHFAMPSDFTSQNQQPSYQNNNPNLFYPFLSPNNNNNSGSACSPNSRNLQSSQYSSAQNSGGAGAAHLLSLDSGLNNTLTNNRYLTSGMKESVGERSFFPQDSRAPTSSYMSAANMANSSASAGGGHSSYPYQVGGGYSRDTSTISDDQHHGQNQHHSGYYLGIDSKSIKPMKVRQDFPTIHDHNNNSSTGCNSNDQKPFHHFFGEWPRKSSGNGGPGGDSWFDYEDSSERSSSNHGSIATTTQLSMAIPMSSHDLSAPFSRFHSDN